MPPFKSKSWPLKFYSILSFQKKSIANANLMDSNEKKNLDSWFGIDNKSPSKNGNLSQFHYDHYHFFRNHSLTTTTTKKIIPKLTDKLSIGEKIRNTKKTLWKKQPWKEYKKVYYRFNA